MSIPTSAVQAAANATARAQGTTFRVERATVSNPDGGPVASDPIIRGPYQGTLYREQTSRNAEATPTEGLRVETPWRLLAGPEAHLTADGDTNDVVLVTGMPRLRVVSVEPILIGGLVAGVRASLEAAQ